MRDNRDKWTFFRHPTKQIIDAKEVLYWKNTLKKILKVGMEFEFNLPDQKGTCKGDSNACPCVEMKDKDCWMKCAKVHTCLDEPNFENCMQQTGTCLPDECAKCEHYKAGIADCKGIYCPGFLSVCLLCKEFAVDCKTCGSRYDPRSNPDEIRARITEEMDPSGCYGHVKDIGVHSITTDGSLLGKGKNGKGVEVITVGRRVDYWEFFKMAKQIIDSSVSKGAYVNERTSIHMHLLASYFGKMFGDSDTGIPQNISELERPLPEIILANYHQLCRRYQNAITWMMVGLDEPHRLTRWEKFRVSVLDISAILNTMSTVKEKVSQNAGGNKYGWVNYNYTNFDKKGDISRLHLEIRVMDCLLSPSAIAASACMYYAMMIKAVEISRWGVVEVGDSEWMEQSHAIKDTLLNGTGGYDGDRFGSTKHLHKYYDILIGESLELVRQLKHILIKIGPAFHILEALAEKPCGVRRCEGRTWEEIEKELAVVTNDADDLEIALLECIDLQYVSECNDVQEWTAQIAAILKENPDLEMKADENIEEKIATYVDDKRNDGEFIWSETLGTVLTL